MASGQTTNYQLNQWEAEDHVLRAEFNEDNAKIDRALAQMSKLGNCQIETGTYNGNGSLDERTLTFSARPLVVLVQSGDGGDVGLFLQGCTNAISLTEPDYEKAKIIALNSSWMENSLTFRRAYTSTTARGQLNESGRKYNYAALMAMDS